MLCPSVGTFKVRLVITSGHESPSVAGKFGVAGFEQLMEIMRWSV